MRLGSGQLQGVLSWIGLTVLWTAAALIGCAEKFDHDRAAAVSSAEEFARVAFVDRDVDKSYALLATATRRYVSLEKHREVIARLHPSGYPRAVHAGELEPMPGEKAIYVSVTGENGAERFYYRLTLEGTSKTGYRILQFDRSRRGGT